MNMQIVSVSSKGQIAIPVSYRKELSLNEGSKLAIFSDGENIILKPITLPSEESLLSALADMREYAKNAGLDDDDVKEAIKASREKGRADEDSN